MEAKHLIASIMWSVREYTAMTKKEMNDVLGVET